MRLNSTQEKPQSISIVFRCDGGVGVVGRLTGSGRGPRLLLHPDVTVHCEGQEPIRVVACGDHRQRDGGSIRSSMQVLGFEPGAEPRIVNLRLALPEIGREAALNLQMTKLQLDDWNTVGKIAPDVISADMETRNSDSLALCLDHHRYLLSLAG